MLDPDSDLCFKTIPYAVNYGVPSRKLGPLGVLFDSTITSATSYSWDWEVDPGEELPAGRWYGCRWYWISLPWTMACPVVSPLGSPQTITKCALQYWTYLASGDGLTFFLPSSPKQRALEPTRIQFRSSFVRRLISLYGSFPGRPGTTTCVPWCAWVGACFGRSHGNFLGYVNPVTTSKK